jgi:hypothetical protein
MYNFENLVKRTMLRLRDLYNQITSIVSRRRLKKQVVLFYWQQVTQRCKELYVKGHAHLIIKFHGRKFQLISASKRDYGITEYVHQ